MAELVEALQDARAGPQPLPAGRSTDDNLIEVVTYRSSERMAAVEVRDNGVGIDSFFTTHPVLRLAEEAP